MYYVNVAFRTVQCYAVQSVCALSMTTNFCIFISKSVKWDRSLCLVKLIFVFIWFQGSNVSLSTHLTPISSHSTQSGLIKPQPSAAKIPSTCTSTSPGKQQQQPLSQSPSSKQQPAIANLIGQPITTLANGFGSPSIPPISTNHPISTPRITSPNSTSVSQSPITNGMANSLAQPPASLSVGVPQPPPATAPTAPTPSVHPGLDSATASCRTNSPAVATSAVLSAAAPAANGNSNATITSSNGSLPSYRSGYPGYPLYAPYNNIHHSPYLPAVPSPSASPRTVDSRTSRESPLINVSKTVRPITPNASSNGVAPITTQGPLSIGSISSQTSRDQPTHQQQQQQQQQHNASSIQRAHSPRGHSPNRERDSYRYVQQ